MATLAQLKEIQSNFSSERQFYLDGYYRLVELADDEFEIEIAAPGYCGDFLPNPKIKFEIDGEQLVPSFLINQKATPVEMIFNKSAEDNERLNQALDQIVDKFIAKIED